MGSGITIKDTWARKASYWIHLLWLHPTYQLRKFMTATGGTCFDMEVKPVVVTDACHFRS